MGVVYLAEDKQLGREVALKVLPATMAADPAFLARFEREARAVAALNHPNIVVLHSVEESDGTRFLVMERVAGDSLDRLLAQRRLELRQIFEIAIPIADALAAAHHQGVVHRDLKPANVMVAEAEHGEGMRVKVLDFGLAKLIRGDSAGQVEFSQEVTAPLTADGAVVGTAAYTSPEQLQGKKLDVRTDLFSFGVLLYEMAAGKRPFTGQSLAELVSSILRDDPPLISKIDPAIPHQLGWITQRCLEKTPGERFQTALDVAHELRGLRRDIESGHETTTVPPSSRPATVPGFSAPTTAASKGERIRRLIAIGRRKPAITVVLVLIAVVAGWSLRRGDDSPRKTGRSQSTSVAAPQAETSVAVLPFNDLSPAGDQEYFTDGLSEELLNALASVPGLRVAARTSSFRFKGHTGDVGEIGQQLGVGAVLEGSVRKAGRRIRISAQLVDVGDGLHLWSNVYDRELDDIFAVQEEIARSVAEALKVTLLLSARLAGKGTSSLDAYQLYLEGYHFKTQMNENGFRKSVDSLRDALELDPDFARAWAELATTLGWGSSQGFMPFAEGFRQAQEAVERALALDPNLAQAHAALGTIQRAHDWDWSAADRSLKRARDLDPGNATLLRFSSNLATTLGHWDEAIRLGQSAVEVDPLNHLVHLWLIQPLLAVDRFDDAESHARRALELEPATPDPRRHLSNLHVLQGRVEEALQEAERIGHPAWRSYSMTLAYFALGRNDEGQAELERFIAEYQDQVAFQIAEIYAYRGDRSPAFEWLERAYTARDPGVAGLKSSPFLASLHEDPRWSEFLRKMKLPV